MPIARCDGIHRTSARNAKLSDGDIGKTQGHNERENESYSNQDIVPERTAMNVHFKTPTAGYAEMFEQMVAAGTISTRGLKADAEKVGELVFDVNSAYFYNHGGYDFAKKFYSDALGQDVYHYHLHVVYVLVVEKEIKWTKRCKDPTLVGTVKERIMQVSMSKKWDSKPVIGVDGVPLKTKTGKTVLKQSYSVLQDDFFEYMRKSGYTDVERGERGSSEEHLTVTQFKVEKEQERLAALTRQTAQKSQEVASLGKRVEKIRKQNVALDAVEKIEAKPAMLSPTKVTLEKSEYEQLKTAARKYVAMERQESKLQKLLDAANRLIADLRSQIATLTQELSKYKSVRNRLSNASLEQENERLRGKIRTYEDVISRNNLWDFFRPNRNKNRNRDDAR